MNADSSTRDDDVSRADGNKDASIASAMAIKDT